MGSREAENLWYNGLGAQGLGAVLGLSAEVNEARLNGSAVKEAPEPSAAQEGTRASPQEPQTRGGKISKFTSSGMSACR